MRLVKVEDIKQNMELAKPIYKEGAVLLTAQDKNLYSYKNRLLKLDINYVYVKDEISHDIEVNDVVSQETRAEGRQIVKKFFADIEAEAKPDLQEISSYASSLIDEILTNKNIIVNMLDIKSTDNYTFAHCVNVAVLSILIGVKAKFNRKKLEKLALGALTHDVGKISIPEDILLKPDKLTIEEYEIIKKHPRLGYERLKSLPEMTPTTLSVILAHHENYKGGGYPKGISKEEIHSFPRIVAIADVFDALTSNRVYREPWPTKKALEYIYAESNKKFDPEYVKLFTKYIPLYPNGTEVELSTGEKALVIRQNKNFPARPVIRKLSSKEEIDLLQNQDITIVT